MPCTSTQCSSVIDTQSFRDHTIMLQNLSRVKTKINFPHRRCEHAACPIDTRTPQDKTPNLKPDGWDIAKSYHEIPGPKPIPILGNTWHFLPIIGKYSGLEQHEMSVKQNKEYGNLVKMSDLKFTYDLISVFNPEDIATVFRNDGQSPERDMLTSIRKYRFEMRKETFQDYGGIFVMDGAEWHHARSLLNPIMMKPQTIQLYIQPTKNVANEFIQKMRIMAAQDPNNEMPVNFFDELLRWALESIAYVAFDSRLGLLDPNLDPNSEKAQFMKNTAEFFILLYKLEIEPNLSKLISTPIWRKYIKISDEITFFVETYIKNKIKEGIKEKPENERTIFETTLKLGYKYALGTALDIFSAGADTTGRTMAATLYYLASNPEVQEKLQAEIKRILPDSKTEITSSKLNEMRYLRAVIKETLRIAPVSLGIVRKTNKDLILSGYQIPKGTHVLLSQLAVSRNAKYFKDPMKFLPDRWLRQDGVKVENSNPWVYFPFSFGPRICIGRRIAQLEMEVLLAKIIRNFKLEWHHSEMRWKMDLIYGIADPLKIRLISHDN